jgi:preprotein translocase SecE subunit
MRAKGTWVLLFFIASAVVVATALSYGFRDLFSWLQIDNFAIMGDAFRVSTLLSVSITFVLVVFFGIFFKASRHYIDQCVIEFNKVAFPEWKETKVATFTVVLVSVVASMVLGIFDAVFSWWTNNNLFIW